MAIAYTLVFCIGVMLCLLQFAPERYRSPIRAIASHSEATVGRLGKTLGAAGIFNEAPTFIIITAVLSALAIGLIFATLFGNPALLLLGPLIVAAAAWLYLNSRQRTMVKTSGDMLVPFIRHMQSSVMAGVTVAKAYQLAVLDSPPAIRRLLDDSLSEMTTGMPFIEALRRTQTRLPLRMWKIFVRQMEIHDESGGDLAKSMIATVEHIDSMVSLQKLGQAQYASFAVQQKIALGLGVVVVFFFMSRLSYNQLSQLWTNPIGVVGLICGILLIAAGFFVTRRALGAIRTRINF
jgi:Flp pilus assembly protein TadB